MPGPTGWAFGLEPSGVPRSCPAEKCAPAPATMMTRVASSSDAARNASSSSRIITRLWALQHFGPVRGDADHGSELFVADGAVVHRALLALKTTAPQ